MKNRQSLLVLVFIKCLVLPSAPRVSAYSKVSRYGQARSGSQDVAFTLAPIFAAAHQRTTVELSPGEVVNHPFTPKYSTLDEQLVSQLDAASTGRKKPQERFHPPASFEHVLSHMRQQPQHQIDPLNPVSSSKDVIYTKPIVTMSYDDYPAPLAPVATVVSKPPVIKDYSFPSYAAPFAESYGPKPSKPIVYELPEHPPKSLEYPPYGHHQQDEEDIIYDHEPDDHHHHHHQPVYYHYLHPKPRTTTMEPEPMDQRLNKRPTYSYYYIGKKLWYVPLYFSIYFIIYIGALVLKSIARHKINFPGPPMEMSMNQSRSDHSGPGWLDYATEALEAIESYSLANH
ncbi:uncharacterized protein LOC106639115 [Copidosoma floridanum]|uniref:uncharacterized protein LOC106639115 n=1 Tax=Copidosoma floridanum TaxID=29053 RepID=UPI0006C993F1|nr:uncharacterized protein LOC106639115 [Copidosoma floridanum]